MLAINVDFPDAINNVTMGTAHTHCFEKQLAQVQEIALKLY